MKWIRETRGRACTTLYCFLLKTHWQWSAFSLVPVSDNISKTTSECVCVCVCVRERERVSKGKVCGLVLRCILVKCGIHCFPPSCLWLCLWILSNCWPIWIFFWKTMSSVHCKYVQYVKYIDIYFRDLTFLMPRTPHSFIHKVQKIYCVKYI